MPHVFIDANIKENIVCTKETVDQIKKTMTTNSVIKMHLALP